MPSAGARYQSFLENRVASLCVIFAGLMLVGCGGGGSSPAEADSGETERETPGATAEHRDAGELETDTEGADAGTVDASDVDAASGARDAGSAPEGGAAPPDGSSDAQAGVNLSGTWITKVETLATESLPLVGEIEVQLELALRLLVTHTANQLEAEIEICGLATETVPDPEILVVTLPPALLATLKTSATSSVTVIHAGDMLPIPQLTIRSGIDAREQAADSDADSQPGVTVPANVGGILPLRVYTGLTVQASITARLTADDEITGAVMFSVNGSVFGSDNPLLTEGTLSVAPKSGAVPLTATRLPGVVPCSEVLTRLQ